MKTLHIYDLNSLVSPNELSKNAETGTADSSPRSGGIGGHMLDISSEEEEDNISLRNSQYLTRPDQVRTL